MKTPLAKGAVVPPHRPAQPQPPRSGGSSGPAQQQPKAVKPSTTRGSRGRPQQDQLALQQIERLQQLEAFLGSAMAHVLRSGIEGPLNWPALVLRPDDSRVQASEEVVDRAAELIEGLCIAVDAELRAALKLAPDAERRKYRLVASLRKDSVNFPYEDTTASPGTLATPIARSARPIPPANSE